MKWIFNSLVSLLYPKLCAGCRNNLHSGEEILCVYCETHLPRTRLYEDHDNKVAELFWGRVPIEYATAFLFFHKTGITQSLIHSLKYKKKKDIGLYLGKLFAHELMSVKIIENVDLIIPIPLHSEKERQRGYNQSKIIATSISNVLNLPIDTTSVQRDINTESQTKKTRYKRWQNVEKKFSVKDPKKLQNKHILLVDDVITTGSTLEACAQILIQYCNAKVYIATLAIAD